MLDVEGECYLVLAIHQDEYISVMGLDMQYVESAMGKSGERSEKMIKTDKVVYRTRTREEYDWLMQELEREGCEWGTRKKPTEYDAFSIRKSDTHILVYNKAITYGGGEYFKKFYKGLECIEVSDIMEDEDESEILDKLEDLKRIEDEFKNLCEKYDEQYDEQKDKTQKIKKIVFTTEVYFE